jgi:hypothetical protein
MQRISLEISAQRRQRALLGQLKYHRNNNNQRRRLEEKHQDDYTHYYDYDYHPAEWRRSLQRMSLEIQDEDSIMMMLMTPIELSNCHLILYSGEIALGSNRQNFRVEFDTASSDLWVPGLNCTDCIEKHSSWRLFNDTASSTYQPASENTEYSLQYDDGETVRHVVAFFLGLVG